MRRSASTLVSLAVAVAVLGLVPGGAASAPHRSTSRAEPTSDLAVHASIVGPRRFTPSSHPVLLVVSMQNVGSTTVGDAEVEYTSVRGGRVVDQLCVLPDEAGIEPDSPGCEPGSLAPGQSARMTLVVRPRTDLTNYTLAVRLCTSDLTGTTDATPGNNCTTKRVVVV